MFESLSQRLQNALGALRGKGRLTEADIAQAMREVRLALLEADVNFKVVSRFSIRATERCSAAEVLNSLTPAQNVVKVVLDELTDMLGGQTQTLELAQNKHPNVVMLVGLQGSGKTTACAKLAYMLKSQGKRPLLAACDVYRPAAADQLETLGRELDIPVYRGDGHNPLAIATESLAHATSTMRDVVIVDTAGRLHIDDAMMDEMYQLKVALEPDEILMVIDAMIGQDALNVAHAFAEKVDFDGVILSKMDGDARGGAALSVRETTGKPIKFISMGEKPDSLEPLHPDRLARRILGMGDMVSLIESAVKVQQDELREEEAQRLAHADLNLNDFLEMNKQIKKIGGISKFIGALPGGDRALSSGKVDEKIFERMETIIFSMTKEEREKPDCINGRRRARIAAGAGVSVTDVNQLMKKYGETRKMVRKMMPSLQESAEHFKKGKKGKKGKLKRRFGGMPGMGMGMPGMGDLKKLQDMLKGS